MKIAFTICSNNYLAHAKTLIDSIEEFAPQYRCIIGLVDKRDPSVDYAFFEKAEIIEVESLNISDFSELWRKYNIIELNTCVKPFYFQHIIERHEDVEEIVYFDPDIRIFNSLHIISEHLASSDILLTPHILTPIAPDGKLPCENLFLNYGLYNLGFLALKKTDNVINLLKWWSERTYTFGYQRVDQGIFVDQLWMNLAPLFFKKAKILDHVGMNVAPWNLHERVISCDGNEFRVNNNDALIFYHFSRYKPENNNVPFDIYIRYSFENRRDLIPLYEIYCKEIINNRYLTFKSIKCKYVEMRCLHEIKDLGINEKEAVKQNSFKEYSLKRLKRISRMFFST